MNPFEPLRSCQLGEVYRRFGKKHMLRLFAPARFSKGEGVVSLQPFLRTNSIFVHVPKAAGLSVNYALYECAGSEHKTIRDFRTLFKPDAFARMFKFTFVRNPWDRLYSAYSFLAKGGLNPADATMGNYLADRYPTFERLVMEGLSDPQVTEFRHFLPQAHLVCDARGTLDDLDFIGRFERIAEDFRTVAARVRPRAELPHRNRTDRSGEDDYRAAFTPAMIERVGAYYARDCELLGYHFEGFDERAG